MKKVLITGAGSYIGTSVEAYLNRPEYAGMYQVDTVDMIGDGWKEKDFSGYDTVFHVAGIAHQRETKKNAPLYYKVNRDLAIETAQKAKKEGVRQFIFLSSMSVYGMEEGVIDKDTAPMPKSHYGRSKLQAEKRFQQLHSDEFKVSVLRLPMVYGKGCKGNYTRLAWLAKNSPIFPYTPNECSAIYIGNLCEFVRLIIEEEKQGLFLPQNEEYVNVSDMVKRIATITQHNILIVKGIDVLVRIFGGNTAKKVLGTLVYDRTRDRCSTYSYGETIIGTERTGKETDNVSFIGKRLLVLMSTYNGEKYIHEQIHSILKQDTTLEIHIRIRDDGSTDKTCDVVNKLQECYPGKIELVRGKNIGCNASFFELLNCASDYDYYAISDQDDVWLQDKLQVACESLNREDNALPLLYASTSYLVDDKLKPYGITRKQERRFTLYNTLVQNICPGHSHVMNNALLKIIQGKIDTSRVYAYDSWITNMAVLYGKVIFNNTPFTCYRQHNKNLMGSSAGGFGQLSKSAKRALMGDGCKYRKQIEYFVKYNEKELRRQGYYNELIHFVDAKSLKEKINYIFHSKLYRQKKIETVAFYAAVLLGRF